MSHKPNADTTDPYGAFADRYDLFFGEFGEHDLARAGFLKSVLETAAARSVLDCACGTAKDLHLLHNTGYRAVGADISTAMLRRGRLNLSAHGLALPLARADFRSLPFSAGAFDAVLCLTTSLPHLLEEEDRFRALEDIHAVLRMGGALILSQGITDKLLAQRPRFIPEIQTRDFTRVFVLDYLDSTVRINVLDFVHGEGKQEFETATFEYATLLPGDYRRLLEITGYTEIEFHDGYTDRPYHPEESDTLVVVARKR